MIQIHSVGVADAILLGEIAYSGVIDSAAVVVLAGGGVQSQALVEVNPVVVTRLGLFGRAVAVEIGDIAIGVIEVALESFSFFGIGERDYGDDVVAGIALDVKLIDAVVAHDEVIDV